MEKTAYDQFISTMLDADLIAVDTETNGQDVRDGRGYAMGVSVAYDVADHGVFSAYFPFRHESDNLPSEWLPALRAALRGKPLVLHNAKFDIPSLATLDIVVDDFYDTMIMAHMYNENWPSKSLDWLSQFLLKDSKDSAAVDRWQKVFGWESVPAKMMEPYARKDAELTLRLYKYLAPRLKEEGTYGLWHFERDFIALLCRMERRGVKLDGDACLALATEGTDRMDAIADQLGFEPSKPSDLGAYLFDELGIPVRKYTDGGKPCLDKEEMDWYETVLDKTGNPTAALVLEYRGWQKAVSSWYQGFVDKVSPDGRLRPNYKVHGTKTGRLSCENPNLQQIPRQSDKSWNGRVKSVLVPAEGYTLWEFDYKQLELRLGAAYCGEQGLMRAFAAGEDIYSVYAVTLFGTLTKDTRFKAKTYVLASQYGAGLDKLADSMSLPRSEVEVIRDTFNESFPGFKRVSKRTEMLAKERGYIRYWTGRRRHYSERWNDGYHRAYNSLIQGGGAELVKHAMLRLGSSVDCDDARMLLQIHDSVVFEIKNGHEDKYVPEIIRVMQDNPHFPVGFDIDAHRWGEG